MNDKQRAEFEKWAKSIPFANLNRHLDGYENSSINTCWSVWKAAIASVVVELPSTYHDQFGDLALDYNATIEGFDKAGIRYE